MVFESPIEEAGSKDKGSRKEQVINLYNSGNKINEISKELGISRQYVSRIVNQECKHNVNQNVNQNPQNVNQNVNYDVNKTIKSEVRNQLKEEVYKEIEEAKQGVLKDIREEIEEFKTEIMREIKKTQGQNAFIKNMLREYLGSEKYEEIKNKIVQNSEN